MNSLLADNTIVSNRYQIIRQIGRGGMGAVYETLDLRLQTTVALKQRMTVDDTYRHAFEREARMLARLRHPGLPIVSDHFFEGDNQFLVMEYVVGPNLHDLLENQHGPLDVAESLRIVDQMLDILIYLHACQPPVIHRDIKPQNIKLRASDQRAMLLDFGLAKGQSSGGSTQTKSSVFGYTPTYAPPEQISGTGTDPHSDLYSLGATLYHMLTGKSPASAMDRMAAMLEKRADPLQAAISINPRLTPALSDVCQRALALAPADRFQTAEEMRTALSAMSSAQPVRVPSLVKVADSETIAMGRAEEHAAPQIAGSGGAGRRSGLWIGVALVLLVLVGGGSAVFFMLKPAGEPTAIPLLASSASVTPTETTIDPTETRVAPTEITASPTEIAIPPTNTPVPPSNTPVPPTNTRIPPSNTPIPPTDTPVPPTDTPVPPTDTPTMRPLPVLPTKLPIRPTIYPTIYPIITPDIKPTLVVPTILPIPMP